MDEVMMIVFIILVILNVIAVVVWLYEFIQYKREMKILDNEIKRRSKYRMYYHTESVVYGIDKNGNKVKLESKDIPDSLVTSRKGQVK